MEVNIVQMDIGLIGGTLGAVLGVVGGIVGTYCSISNCKSRRQKKFMIKASIYCWLAITLFLLLLLATPTSYVWLVWIPYGVLLPIGINAINRGIARIQQEELEEKTLSRHGSDPPQTE